MSCCAKHDETWSMFLDKAYAIPRIELLKETLDQPPEWGTPVRGARAAADVDRITRTRRRQTTNGEKRSYAQAERIRRDVAKLTKQQTVTAMRILEGKTA